MSSLHLLLLGRPEVRHGDHALTFRTRKVLALLAYLAVERRGYSREHLIALLWPDSDSAHGRMALRSTLAWLRDALADPVEAHNHLIVTRDALACDLQSDLLLDLQSLPPPEEPAYDMAERSPASVLTALRDAADAYRGPFMDGFSLGDAPGFDQWMALWRETYDRRLAEVLGRLSQAYADHGDVAGAIEAAARLVALDPLDENAALRLMRIYLAHGDRSAALRVYEKCRATLAAELRVEPGRSLTALAERARVSSTMPVAPRRLIGALLPPPAAIEAPLVGRADEIASIRRAFDALQHGPRAILVDGDAGIGKTRLVGECLIWARLQGADVLQGRAFETGGRLPYQPVVDALRGRLARENAPDDLLADIWLTELSRLLPELRERYPDLPAPDPDDTAANTRLFEAIATLGQALAARAPLVLFIDDIQWSDSASLDALQYAMRRWAAGTVPVLLIVAARREAGAHAAWYSELGRDIPVDALHLETLDEEDSLRLIRFLASEPSMQEGLSPQAARFARWFFGETAGQPLYMMETLKALIERGVLAPRLRSGSGWGIDFVASADPGTLPSAVPAGVRDVIQARLAALASDTRSLLAAAAVLGRGFTFEHLCQVAKLGEEAGLLALDHALAGRLLREPGEAESPAGVDTLAFTHDKIRDVIYDELGDTRRRIFHRRALELLEAAAMPPAVLAPHALGAGLTVAAFHHHLAAGDAAMALFAVRDALNQYELARGLLPVAFGGEDSSAQAAALERLYVGLGRCYELIGSLAQARSIYEALLSTAEERHLPGLAMGALNRLATVALHDGLDVATATSCIQRVIVEATASGDRLALAEAEWNLAQFGFYVFDADASVNHGSSALALARSLGSQELIARCLNVIGYGETGLGRWTEAAARFAEAAARYRDLGNRAMEADCLSQLAHVHFHVGDLAAGLAAGRNAQAIVRSIENPWGQVESATVLTFGLLDSGAYAEALAVAEEGVAIARAHGMTPMLIYILLRLGAVHRAVGALDRALAAHDEVVRLNEALAPRPFAAMVAAELCADHAAAHDWPSAGYWALQALAAPPYPTRYGDFVRWHIIAALLHTGDPAAAQLDLQRFGRRLGENRRLRIPYLRAEATIAGWGDDTETAIRRLREAALIAAELGLAGEQQQVEAALIPLHRGQGDHRAAEALAARMVDQCSVPSLD